MISSLKIMLFGIIVMLFVGLTITVTSIDLRGLESILLIVGFAIGVYGLLKQDVPEQN